MTFRNVGIGYCSAVARIGGIMAPVIFMLAVISPVLPYIIFGFFGIFGAFCAFFLPEVLDRTLPDSVEEVKLFFVLRMYNNILCQRVKSLVKENPQHWMISKEWSLAYSEQQKRQGNIIKFANRTKPKRIESLLIPMVHSSLICISSSSQIFL